MEKVAKSNSRFGSSFFPCESDSMYISSAQRLSPISVQDYLAGEQNSRLKHEYVAGKVYAMAGETYSHNLIASNLMGELHTKLKGKSCRVLNSDSKVKIHTGTQARFYYPDASVVCGENVLPGVFQDKPTLIAEVLSDSTRRTDEGEKLEAYQTITTLNVYMLIEHDTIGVIVYRRTDEGFKREVYPEMSDNIFLPEIRCRITLSQPL